MEATGNFGAGTGTAGGALAPVNVWTVDKFKRLRCSMELTALGNEGCSTGGGSIAEDGMYIFCKNCSATEGDMVVTFYNMQQERLLTNVKALLSHGGLFFRVLEGGLIERGY